MTEQRPIRTRFVSVTLVCPVCGVKLNRACRKVGPLDRRPRPHVERAKVEAEAKRRWEEEGIPWA